MKKEARIWTEHPKDTEDRELPTFGNKLFVIPYHLKHTSTLGITTVCFIHVCLFQFLELELPK